VKTASFPQRATQPTFLRQKPVTVTLSSPNPPFRESINTIVVGCAPHDNSLGRKRKKVGAAHLDPWRLAHPGGVSFFEAAFSPPRREVQRRDWGAGGSPKRTTNAVFRRGRVDEQATGAIRNSGSARSRWPPKITRFRGSLSDPAIGADTTISLPCPDADSLAEL